MVFPELVSIGKGSTGHRMDLNFILVSNGFQVFGSYCFSYGDIGSLVSIGV